MSLCFKVWFYTYDKHFDTLAYHTIIHDGTPSDSRTYNTASTKMAQKVGRIYCFPAFLCAVSSIKWGQSGMLVAFYSQENIAFPPVRRRNGNYTSKLHPGARDKCKVDVWLRLKLYKTKPRATYIQILRRPILNILADYTEKQKCIRHRIHSSFKQKS